MKFISGRKNCHLKGMNSYVIRDRVSDADGMVRVFHNTEDCVPGLLDGNGRYWLAPHNHRQDITLSYVRGLAWNVNFEWDERSHDKKYREWIFRSGLLGEGMSAHYHNSGDLRITDIQPIGRDGLFLKYSQIHTVIAEPGASWLIREGATAPQGSSSLCYSRHSPFELSMDGLYRELSREELNRREAEFTDWKI